MGGPLRLHRRFQDGLDPPIEARRHSVPFRKRLIVNPCREGFHRGFKGFERFAHILVDHSGGPDPLLQNRLGNAVDCRGIPVKKLLVELRRVMVGVVVVMPV